ncbi:hypothetical protein J8J27_25985, partial [Mycobacterium tuberculosis]|nr:hypothetical protein [Mycobacterium tuberculosis]
MGLGTRFADILAIRVEGEGSEATADALLALILAGLGDPIADAPAPEAVAKAELAAMPSAAAGAPFAAGANAVVRGRSAVAGLAVGPVIRY